MKQGWQVYLKFVSTWAHTLQLMTGKFSNPKQLRVSCQWGKKVSSLYENLPKEELCILKNEKRGQQIHSEKFPLFLQKSNEIYVTCHVTCQHLQLQVYTRVIKSLADWVVTFQQYITILPNKPLFSWLFIVIDVKRHAEHPNLFLNNKTWNVCFLPPALKGCLLFLHMLQSMLKTLPLKKKCPAFQPQMP